MVALKQGRNKELWYFLLCEPEQAGEQKNRVVFYLRRHDTFVTSLMYCDVFIVTMIW